MQSSGLLAPPHDPTVRAVLEAILSADQDGVTRAELGARLSLSPTTISTTIDRLGRAVESVHRPRAGKSGPPPEVLSVPATAGVVLAADISPRGLRACVCDVYGDILNALPFHDADVEDNPMDSMQWLADAASVLLDDADPASVVGVGIAVSGPVDLGEGAGDLRHGVLREDTIMSGWGGISPAHELEQLLRWDCPFLVDNDATLAAVAERRWGAAQGMSNVLLIQWASGIGAGLIIDGRVARGASGIAGELGHCAVILTDEHRALVGSSHLPECSRCGRHCLERVAGTRAIQAAAGVEPGSPVTDLLAAWDRERELPEDERHATRALWTAAAYVGQVLGTCVNLLNPEAIVIGGDFPPSVAHLYRAWLMAELKRQSISSSFGDVGVLPGALGDRAPMMGAVALVLEQELTNYLLK